MIDFIGYLKTLTPEDWNKMVTATWTVKDVVAHMVGWEKNDPDAIAKAWETKEPPWWMTTDGYDEFNQKNVEFYKNYSPEELLAEWGKWQKHVEVEMDKIGIDNLKSHPDLFGWLFDEGNNSHYAHHYQQIKNAVEKS